MKIFLILHIPCVRMGVGSGIDHSILSPDIDRIALLKPDISNRLVVLQFISIKHQVDLPVHVDPHLPLIAPHDLLDSRVRMNTQIHHGQTSVVV